MANLQCALRNIGQLDEQIVRNARLGSARDRFLGILGTRPPQYSAVGRALAHLGFVCVHFVIWFVFTFDFLDVRKDACRFGSVGILTMPEVCSDNFRRLLLDENSSNPSTFRRLFFAVHSHTFGVIRGAYIHSSSRQRFINSTGRTFRFVS